MLGSPLFTFNPVQYFGKHHILSIKTMAGVLMSLAIDDSFLSIELVSMD